MDHARFAALRRSVSTMLSRRQLTAAATGALATAGFTLPGVIAPPAAAAKRRQQAKCTATNKTCSKNKKAKNACKRCCTGAFITRGKTRTCICRAEGQPCTKTSQCCGGTCDTGACATITSYTPGRVYSRPELDDPSGLGIALNGDLYVSILSSPAEAKLVIQQFNRSGAFIRSWGNRDELDDPTAVAVGPDGTVYVTDYLNYKVHRFTPKGVEKTAWGPQILDPDNAGAVHPQDIAVDSRGNVAVVLTTGNSDFFVAKFTAAGHQQWTTRGSLASPHILSVAIGPNDEVNVLPAKYDPALEVYDPDDGHHITTLPISDWSDIAPPCLGIDRSGNVYIGTTNSVRKYDPTGNNIIANLSADFDDVPLGSPEHLTVTPDGTVFVVDQDHDRVVAFTPA